MASNKLLTHLNLIRPCSETPLIEDCFVVINDDTFGSITPAKPDGDYDEVIDCRGRYALPGQINAHHHLYSTLALGMPPPAIAPADFLGILEQVWWKLDRALDTDSLRASVQSGLVESLQSGTTTIIDHHSSPECVAGSLSLVAETAHHYGVGSAVAIELSDRNGPDCFNKCLEETITTKEKYSKNNNITTLLGLHASFTLGDRSLQTISETLALDDSMGIHLHLSEDAVDERDAQSRGYPSVLQRLHHFDLLNTRSLLVHGVNCPQADTELMQQLGTMLIHNPTSNANNRIGMLDRERAITLNAGLGTDGMQSNMLKEAKEGTLIRNASINAGEPSLDYLTLLFEHNPTIASRIFDRPLGRVEPGYRADLAIYDYLPRTEITPDNLGSHLLFGFPQPSEVYTSGELRVSEGQMTQLDEQQIKADALIQSNRLWKQLL